MYPWGVDALQIVERFWETFWEQQSSQVFVIRQEPCSVAARVMCSHIGKRIVLMKNAKAIGIASCLAVVLSGILISAPAEARHKNRFYNNNNCNNGWSNSNWSNSWNNGNHYGWRNKRKHFNNRWRRNAAFNQQYNPYFNNGQFANGYPYNYGNNNNISGRIVNYLRGF